jgi:uncharacterized membrane protein
MQKLNNFIASKLSVVMSSMWLFWLLALILIVLWLVMPNDEKTNPYTIALFWISTAFQAIALPVLAFVSNLQGDRAEKIAKETHDAVMKELKLLRDEQSEMKKLLNLEKSLKK